MRFLCKTFAIYSSAVPAWLSLALLVLLRVSPSVGRSFQKLSEESRVMAASAINAWWMAVVSTGISLCGSPFKNQEVKSEPEARPKLMESCCMELARVLAWLASLSETSA